MTRKTPEPLLPPGRVSFPQHPTGVVRLLRGRNHKHARRWISVRQQRDESPNQTWEETFQAVADMEDKSKRSVAWATIESSYKKVETAIKAGKSSQFFISDWPRDSIPDSVLKARKTRRY
jgi:hypothetical protein